MPTYFRSWRWLWPLAVCLLLLASWSSQSAAHGLAMDQLLLRPDFKAHELRGQITFDPHHTRTEDRAESLESVGQRVLTTLQSSVVIEIDGTRCPLELEIRELWVPAGATVGDIVGLRCPLPPAARELRVFAGSALSSLVVSVEAEGGAGVGALSRSVLIPGGTATPAYHFASATGDWRAGGANQFLPDGGLASSEPAPAETPSAEAPRVQPRVRESTGFEEASAFTLATRYVRLGFVHILPFGWDHVLFVAGLVLGSRMRLRPLILQLSAFTLAHTLTLGLGALGWVVLPPRVVEPLIAFSIAFVAVENLRGRDDVRRRLALVLLFGLLHGQGFASALAQIGLAREAFLLSLVSFNVGVELGQLVVVALLALGLVWIRDEAKLQRFAVRPGSLGIGLIGLVWGIQRLLA